MSTEALDTIRTHPRLQGLAETPGEEKRLGDFARDVAGWLYGEDESTLGPLARVVVKVARRELSDPMRLCKGRTLLAVEAGARAVQVLWPLVKDTFPDPEPEPEPEPQPEPQPEREPEEQEQTEASEGCAEGEGDGQADEQDAEDQPADGNPDGQQPPEQPSDGSDGQGQPQPGEGEPDEGEPGEGEQQPQEAGAGEGSLEELEQALQASLEQLSAASAEACGGALEAERVARHLERFLPGIGWSSSPGQLDRTLLDRLEELSSLLQRLPALKDLADRLGRLEDASRRAGPQHGGGEEVAGVHLGGEVAHALPVELALLGDPSTEDLFYQRFTERRLLSLELSGRGMDGTAAGDRRGPVIAAIDTSGSMEGAPEQAAKALVLAICRRVLPQNRAVHLLLFGGVGEHTEIRLRRGLGGLEGLVDFLSLAFQAGTDFDTPLSRALELLEERDLHRADILVVTDGLCRATPAIVEEVASARAERGVRVLSVVLGQAGTGGVDPFSDEVWQLDPDAPDEAVTLFRRLSPA